jgi:hypothetical protein
MSFERIQGRGRGPEIIGTRITIFNLLPHLMDPNTTEVYLSELYGLTPEEVAAARAYTLIHWDAVWAEHLRIEARIAEGNPPNVIERANQTHAEFLSYKQRLEGRKVSSAEEQSREIPTGGDRRENGKHATYREWIAEKKSQAGKGS